MNTKGVIIDEEKAYIRGLNQDFVSYKIISFDLFSEIDVTGRELTGALFHEGGHDFSWIADTYLSIRIVGTLIEALQETNDKPLRSRLKLMNRTMGGGKLNLNADDSEEQLYLKFQNRFLSELTKMSPNNSEVAVESERMADEFATRFGLGKDVASLFMKFKRGGSRVRPFVLDTSFSSKLSKILIMLFLMAMASYGIILLAQLFVYFLIGIAFTSFIITSTVDMVLGSEMSNEKTYDTLMRRLERIRLNEIRSMRNTEDEDLIQNKMETIRYIDSLLVDVKDGISFFASVGDKLPWNYNVYKITKDSRTLEDGIDNSLHVSKQRNLRI
jgi:hypothetical protein